jgi:multidrug resistance protein, MATE family
LTNQMERPYKTILTLALPMATAQVLTMTSGFLCMTMLAKLGADVLAASALIFSTQMSVMVIGMSSLFSLSILIGHAYGNRDYDRVGLLVQQGWTMAALISIPIMLLLWHIGSILIYFGQLKNIAAIVQKYFYVHTWRILPVMLAVCNQQLCYGVRKQKVDIIANVFGVIVLLVSANTLIFGKFGFPALGVRGFAYAVTLQSTFYFIFTSICLLVMDDFKLFKLFRYRLHQNWGSMIEVFKFSWPITLQISCEMVSLFVTAAMMGWLGVQALAAYQVVTQYLFVFLIPVFALSQATGVLVGQACGAKQYDAVQSLGNASLVIAVMVSVFIGIVFLSFPDALASMYINIHAPANASTLKLIGILFMAATVTMFFDTVRNILTGALRGTFDTRYPMITGLVAIWLVGLPASYLFAFKAGWGALGIMLGTVVAMILGAGILLVRWIRMSAEIKNKMPDSGQLSGIECS